MEYKKVKKIVPWCNKCNVEIRGNGSSMFPYTCMCGEWKFDKEKYGYFLATK